MADNPTFWVPGKRTEQKDLLFFAFLLPAFALMFGSGCAQRQKAVDLYVEAVMRKTLNERELAIDKLNAAAKTDKHYYPAYSLLGEIYEEMQRYEDSAAAYQKATELNPWSSKDCLSLGRVLRTLKRYPEAVQIYDRACEINRDDFEAHLYAAQSCYELKDYERALSYGRRAERLDPNVYELQKLLGDIYKLQKDYDQAVAAYELALELDSDNPDVMISLAAAYMNSDRIEPAKELLNHVLKMEPGRATAHRHLGYCCLLLGDVDGAIESYERAIEINENDWQALRSLGIAYIFKAIKQDDQQFKAKAVTQWRMSLDINPHQRWARQLRQYVRKYSK